MDLSIFILHFVTLLKVLIRPKNFLGQALEFKYKILSFGKRNNVTRLRAFRVV